MVTRWVLHRDELGRVNTSPLLRDLADDVAEVATRIVPIDTGDLKSTVRVLDVDEKSATVGAGGIPGEVTGEMVDYAAYQELGTRNMSAQPYLKPATYRYLSP